MIIEVYFSYLFILFILFFLFLVIGLITPWKKELNDASINLVNCKCVLNLITLCCKKSVMDQRDRTLWLMQVASVPVWWSDWELEKREREKKRSLHGPECVLWLTRGEEREGERRSYKIPNIPFDHAGLYYLPDSFFLFSFFSFTCEHETHTYTRRRRRREKKKKIFASGSNSSDSLMVKVLFILLLLLLGYFFL